MSSVETEGLIAICYMRLLSLYEKLASNCFCQDKSLVPVLTHSLKTSNSNLKSKALFYALKPINPQIKLIKLCGFHPNTYSYDSNYASQNIHEENQTKTIGKIDIKVRESDKRNHKKKQIDKEFGYVYTESERK